ncbi:hypothetical protein PR001_g27616 [Phytophthora rubi]|uniref:Uncharacterized protein n=1 Tax=Phytophthora rubi TaxID=129364 RepID=A0A6A3HKH8_9STRA|nr:hypothetical protein PR002_g27596 [Phytophthora rubi]KAE8969042.1 hypothetical protein PR001_g27616 [Phytophthora rubi]
MNVLHTNAVKTKFDKRCAASAHSGPPTPKIIALVFQSLILLALPQCFATTTTPWDNKDCCQIRLYLSQQLIT